MNTTRRYAAALAGVAAVLAVAAPIADASAATTPAALPEFPGFPLPAFAEVPPSFVGLPAGSTPVAVGPTIIGAVFNGPTVVQVANAPASSVVGSP
jgi:hypothetical protein